MEKPDNSSPGKLPPVDELERSKTVVRSVMMDAYREEAMAILNR